MKVRHIAILILAINFLKAQVAPPQLRCLSVGAGGNVVLTWIPPADPGGQFFSYEICHSITQNGVYTIVGTVSSIGTTTFNHATTVANNQAAFYFVKTKFGPGGVNASATSDTLKTIFLNFNNPGDGVAHLSYNNLHQPPLASTSVSFAVNREHPTATWVNLQNTGKLNYKDSIVICTPQTYNYQISIGDGSGCISNSNIQGGILEDKNGPTRVPLDSVSVLPNGQTVIGYQQSISGDCSDYRILQVISSINTTIAVNPGKTNTIFTFTSSAATQNPLEFLIAPMDSCGNDGILNDPHRTIYLDHTYDKCNYQTQLSWTAYKGWAVSKYNVYYSVNGGPFQLLGSTNTTFFTHTGVDPDKNVTYYVRAFKGDGVTSSSNRITFFSYQTIAPDFIYISSVSVKTDEAIQIKFIVDALKMGSGFDLYRSDDGISYKKIAFIPFTGGPNYNFTDTEDLETRTKSYYYKALAKDSCGNDRTQSSIVKSVWLQVANVQGSMFEKRLAWNNYTVFAGGLGGYSVYRIVNDVMPSQPTGYTNGMDNEYIDNVEDVAEQGSKIEYMVIAVEALGNPNNIAETANSNRATTYVEADVFIPSAFAPNGVNKEWRPVTHFVDKNDYNLRIYNRWGNLLFNTNDDTKGWNGAGATNDTYIYLITYKNSRGEYVELKGTFTLL